MAITARLRLGSDNRCQRRNSAASQTKEDIMSGMSEIRELADHELDAITGGNKVCEVYSCCPEGLKVGDCAPTGADLWNTFIAPANALGANIKPM
jgi:hypothetical protein